MLYQYNPVHLISQIATEIKIEGEVELASGCVDRYKNDFLVKTVKSGKEIIYQLDRQKFEASFDLQASVSTPFLQLNNKGHFLLFVPSIPALQLVDFEAAESQDFPLQTPSQRPNSQYELFYFNRTAEICLAEKSEETSKLTFTFFNFQQAEQPSIIEQYNFETQWKTGEKLFRVTPHGKLGWCGSFKKTLEIKLFENGKGVNNYSINLQSLQELLPSEEMTVMAMWQKENFLYLVINPKDDPSLSQGYSPILRINFNSNDFSPLLIQLDNAAELLLRDCLDLDDYVVLFSSRENEGKNACYIFDKDLELIVANQQIASSLKPIKTSFPNTYLLVEKEASYLRISERIVSRVTSLSFQKALQLTERAQTAAKTIETGIVILGGDKTGKSALRHYLAGEKLLHRYNEEFGFYEMVTEVDQMKGLEHEVQREQVPWLSCTKDAAILDLPDWNHRGDFFKAQVNILLTRFFRTFKKVHFLITIPEEYIQSSDHNEQFITSLVNLLGRDENLYEYLSIVLTKVETAQDSLANFTDRIQEIEDLNQESGKMVRAISEGGRILVFENREVSESEGKAMRDLLLSFPKTEGNPNVEQPLKDSSPAIDALLHEEEYHVRVLNAFLQWTANKLSTTLFPYIPDYINHMMSHRQQVINPSKELNNKDSVGAAFITALAKLKALLTKPEERTQKRVDELKESLIALAEQLTTELQETTYFSDAVLAFTAVVRNCLILPLQPTTGQQTSPLAFIIRILQEEQQGILGQGLKEIIIALQKIRGAQESPEWSEFDAVKSQKGAVRKVRRVIQVQMTLEQQKKEVRKRHNILQEICKLPVNALKLDLICEELKHFCNKKKLEAKDYKVLYFYLRQASKICQYHQLYYEAMVLLYVIPDFTGLERLVDLLAQHLKRTAPYEARKLLSNEQQELLDKLLVLASDFVRDNLVKKLINLTVLSSETTVKPAKLRVEAQNKAAQYLSSKDTISRFRQRLNKQGITEYYNIKDQDFCKLLDKRQSLVEKCIRYEEQETTKRTFEETEALRYMLDDLPIPA